MVGLRIIAILIFGLLVIKPALSQTLPLCISIASDADGDGYGWENDASCVITSTSQCIDTDGDGWGWNGITSCQLLEVAAPVCADSPPVGDGWGWNGITSCQLEVTAPVCVDSPPVGDSWGWDGITSCVIENTVVADLDNIPDPLLQFTPSTIITPSELLNVPLSCRRVRWLTQFETNEAFDIIESRLEQDPSREFFTATFQQNPLNGSFSIEGSWDDIYMLPVSLSWDMNTNNVLYGPVPNGNVNFHMHDQFIVIGQSESFDPAGNSVDGITSYCVIQ